MAQKWYGVTWLHSQETSHSTMGRFRPNETKPLQLPPQLAAALAHDSTSWRIEPTNPPRGKARREGRVSVPSNPGPPPAEAHVFIDLSLSILGPTAMAPAEPQTRSVDVRVSLAETQTPQVRAARRALTQHLDAALGELFRAHKGDYQKWARRNRVTLSYERYYGKNLGGRPRGRRVSTEPTMNARIRELRRRGKTTTRDIFHAMYPGRTFTEAERKRIERVR
jgi:hypothetical protein